MTMATLEQAERESDRNPSKVTSSSSSSNSNSNLSDQDTQPAATTAPIAAESLSPVNSESRSDSSDGRGSSASTYEAESTTLEFSSLNPPDKISPSTLQSENHHEVQEEEEEEEGDVNGALKASKLDLRDEQGKAGDDEEVRAAKGRGREFVISWHELSYVVESKWYKLTSQRKPILNKMSGSFRSGELSAVLGPSGAGKSTLIDCLLGKRESRNMSGRTQVSFSNLTYEQERRKSRPLRIATIPQADHLLDTLSVTETFMFASRIKNAHLETMNLDEEDTCDDFEEKFDEKKIVTSSEEDLDLAGSRIKIKSSEKSCKQKRKQKKPFDHFANVQRVIQQLNLSSCATTRCGKLSGGQYKRVSIGQELLSRPDLMILDEPTSGLDSVTCQQTVSALRYLIESSPYPMAIVATIHQPDYEVFQLFHKAYVLAEGGRAIFEGSIDSIYTDVRSALELVEWRRSQRIQGELSGSPTHKSVTIVSDGKLSAVDPLAALRNRLELSESGYANPARLLVELAAGEFGFEIQGALNELQSRTHELSDDYSAGRSQLGKLEHFQLEQVRPGKASSAPVFDYEANEPSSRRAQLDKLLKLGAANKDQLCTWRVWWRHMLLHTKRSWLTIVRDPMLFAVQLALHILVPLLISYAFQNQVTQDACPRVGPLDVVHETYRRGNVLDDLNQELRVSLENLGYIFFQLYVIIFAAVCVTSLTYPLAMHVLLKEHRNGWYSMSSYFLGRTLADLPVPSFNVLLAIAISYHLTGQPADSYHWRYWSVALLTVFATLVAQTMGLFFGAILMNAPQSAVFVAPASTAPLVVVCGFLLRIKSLPYALQLVSKLSYFTHLINGVIISRYGFNRCPCKPEDFHIEDSHQVPSQTRAIIDLWIESFAVDYATPQNGTLLSNATIGGSQANSALAGQEYFIPERVDLVGKLVSTITRAKNFDFKIDTCEQVKPFVMLDYQLEDSDLFICFLALITMLIACRWFVYLVLSWRISSRI